MNSTWPMLKWPKLKSLLLKQGFTVEDTKAGVRVTAASGAMHTFHLSTLETSAYYTVIRDLMGIGLMHPDDWRAKQRSQRTKAAIEARRGEYPCDFEGCSFVAPLPNALGAHKRGAHGIVGSSAARPARQAKATASANGTPSAGPVRVREVEPADPRVKARKLVTSIRNHAEGLDMALSSLLEMYDAEYEARIAAEQKLRKVTNRLQGAVDAL